MASEQTEVCAISLLMREKHIKIMKCHPSSDSVSIDENVGKWLVLCITNGDINLQISMSLCSKMKICTSTPQNFQ